MLTVYGIQSCKDCRLCKLNFDNNKIDYQYKDFASDIKNLKEFLSIRDKESMFDEVKQKGGIGIPLIITDKGEYTFDWQQFVPQDKLIATEQTACSIDGKGC